MDEVKKYLFENRDELDLEKAPRPQVWKRIRQETTITPRRVIPLRTKWFAAAAAAVAAAVLLTLWLSRPEQQQVVADTGNNNPVTVPEQSGQVDSTHTDYVQGIKEDSTTEMLVDNTPKEHKTTHRLVKRNDSKPAIDKEPLSPIEAIEDNYAVMINQQLKKLSKTPIYVEDAGYFHVFKKQWLDMQRDEQEIKQDMLHYGFTDGVVKQFIQVYQQKLKLLKDLQTEINKMNIRAKQHPALERPKPTYLKL